MILPVAFDIFESSLLIPLYFMTELFVSVILIYIHIYVYIIIYIYMCVFVLMFDKPYDAYGSYDISYVK